MQNKNYRLLKDLPFAKAGEIFESRILDDGKEYMFWGEIKIQNIKNFDEWFEEVEEDKEEKFSERIFYILPDGVIDTIETVNYSNTKDNRKEYKEYKEKLKSVGNCFKTEEETERHIDYLMAKEVIRQDTKGFKPDWENFNEEKYYGVWDFDRKKTDYFSWSMHKSSDIFFKSIEDIEESFEKHPKEWKAYLTYDQ